MSRFPILISKEEGKKSKKEASVALSSSEREK